MTLVVDASVGLKWVLDEPDSDLAQAVAQGPEELLMPDFWLNEAVNVLWLQVRRRIFKPDEAQEALVLLRAQVPPTPTATLDLHEVALGIGMSVDHSPYDTLYVAFAIAMGARGVVTADARLVTDLRRHPDAALAGLLIPLAAWGQAEWGQAGGVG